MTGGYNLPPNYGYGGGFAAGYQSGQQYMMPPQQQMQPQSQRQQPQQSQMSYVCVPVTSREEAVATRADALTLGTLMPDLVHGCVYLKRFNPNTGSPEFFEFLWDRAQTQPQQQQMMQPQQQQQTQQEWVARSDFEQLCNIVMELQGELKKLKGGEENAE